MKSDVTLASATMDDAGLVALGLEGDRDAFGQLVARYQSPLCAMAYSACGDISQSEDVAQETFVIAWRKLAELKEPTRFKSWLFGIARNRINDSFRRRVRNPLAGASPLDDTIAAPTPSLNPTEQAISKEEEQILWRSLANMPEAYREPLVLFYREQQSVERVAAALDLREDTVRQRLSRGRKLLQEQVLAFVEGALAHSGPGNNFTLTVMAALPAVTMATASTIGGTVLKSGATGKAVAAGWWCVPILWLACAVTSTWGAIVRFPKASRARKFVTKAWTVFWAVFVLYFVWAIVFQHYADWRGHYQKDTAILLASVFIYGAFLAGYGFWTRRAMVRLSKEDPSQTGQGNEFLSPYDFKTYEYRSTGTFLGLPLVHVKFNGNSSGPPAKGWIAFGTKAYGVIFAGGGRAVGFMSWGAMAIGVFAWGGVGLGIFSFGGFALGLIALGGGAIGYLAYGGGSIGWLGASGGAVLSRHYASGGGAIAPHANDHAAEIFMQQSLFFRHALPLAVIMITISWLIPVIFIMLRRKGGPRPKPV